MDPTVELRTRVRSAWIGAGGMLEVMMGPEMHHDERDLELLVSATLPMAEAFGLEWLGSWVHIIGFAGAVAAVELPKLRDLRLAQARRAGQEVSATTPTRPSYPKFEDAGDAPPAPPAPVGARAHRGPAPTDGE